MPSGQLMTMPVLIVNMGGEMVYILEQRLQAQKIPDTKGQKVLNDVVRTMYYPRFVEELFKPQEMYSVQSTRQIFDRLAHSSIMRLNESSMDKLFDLMAMGFKYQLISCMVPQEIIDITHNHLDVLKRLVAGTAQVAELVDECIRQMQMAYGQMSLWDFNALRQSLCCFFQDRKVKVSLFLHDQTQNPDGCIVVPSGGTLAIGAQPPGTVRYFQGGAEVSREALPVVHAAAWKSATGVRTALGSNVYEKDKAPSAQQAAPPPAATPMPQAVPAAQAGAATGPSASAKTAAAVGELNALASLIGAAPATETFKLENLFGADIFKGETGPTAEIIQIDGTAPSEHRRGLDSVREQMDVGGGGGGAPDDLLDLMDKA
mmetsp:Transcript_69416/g.206800  ORF Transcript_69416/g.206800 Transcript_69416/m.206800 type:complete len:374 (-) Transcript_69416:87-1208(-)|eukprot:CAMPEP_0175228310 /NCGR_PEP_ID=MMETSP0093-20121207/23853_1 /TAXON_ID=311494 /ORGANISM="Alexandrium monilatum, Strain CCMP3105" /LENGTH=373 /DNA_ID=CAMNT_0016522083 /DNA_START=76 /DNA_END=1197 /DNA_ORIENTATION=-